MHDELTSEWYGGLTHKTNIYPGTCNMKTLTIFYMCYKSRSRYVELIKKSTSFHVWYFCYDL